MLGIEEIEKIIPHRHPFLLIDRLEELLPGVRAVGCRLSAMMSIFFGDIFQRSLLCRECW